MTRKVKDIQVATGMKRNGNEQLLFKMAKSLDPNAETTCTRCEPAALR